LPIIIAALAFIGAIIYGLVRLHTVVAQGYGPLAGALAVLLCVALMGGLALLALRRYRAIHGVTVDGRRHVSIEGQWGGLTVDANGKHGSLNVAAQTAEFLFADIESAVPVRHDGAWTLALRLRHNARAEWTVPMPDGATARRWARILTLANAQKL
jgi:hypothetical protein